LLRSGGRRFELPLRVRLIAVNPRRAAATRNDWRCSWRVAANTTMPAANIVRIVLPPTRMLCERHG